MTSSQETYYTCLQKQGYEYEFTAAGGDIFMALWDYTVEAKYLKSSVVIPTEGHPYQLPVF